MTPEQKVTLITILKDYLNDDYETMIDGNYLVIKTRSKIIPAGMMNVLNYRLGLEPDLYKDFYGNSVRLINTGSKVKSL